MFITPTVTQALLLLPLQTNLPVFVSESYMIYASRGDLFIQCVMHPQSKFTACNNLTDTQPQWRIVCIAPLLPWGHKWNLFCI